MRSFTALMAVLLRGALCTVLVACARSALSSDDRLAVGDRPSDGASGGAGGAGAHGEASSPGGPGGEGAGSGGGQPNAGASGRPDGGVGGPIADGGRAGSGGQAGNDPPRVPDAGSVDAAVEHRAPWRDGAAAFCIGATAVASLDVWSDARGVFVLAGGAQSPRIFSNSGREWQVASELAPGSSLRLSGFPDGPLVVQAETLCGLRFVSSGVERCSAAVNGSQGFFAVSRDRAYAGNGNNVLVFDGKVWTPRFTTSSLVLSIWANDQTVVVGNATGLFANNMAGELIDEGIGARRFGSVWGGAAGPAWAGASTTVLYRAAPTGSWGAIYDTASEARCDRIDKMWGFGEAVFIANSHMLAVHDGFEVRTIIEWPCDTGVELTGCGETRRRRYS